MYLSIQFDYREHSKNSLQELGLADTCSEHKTDSYCWSLATGNFMGLSGNKSFSRLLGKKLISPFPLEKSGIYGAAPEPEKEFASFIIDMDEFGEDVLSTSNPDMLGNNFGANPGQPHYLTPVYFDKQVLERYYHNPSRYSVSDSYLECASLWGIQLDNHHDDKVCAWLGDLGRDLPYSDQLHWKSFNVTPKGSISDVYFKRQILARFTDSERLEDIFLKKYSELKKLSETNLGWALLLPLAGEDKYHLECLRSKRPLFRILPH